MFSCEISSISFQIKKVFFNFSCRNIFLVMNSFNFCLSGKLLSVFFTSQVELCWVEYSQWEVFFFFLTFSTQENQGISFWPAKFQLKNLLVILWVFLGNKLFFLAVLKILSLSLTFATLTIMCLGMDFFAFILFGTLSGSQQDFLFYG